MHNNQANPQIPNGWRKVDSRKFPGCSYFIKPDGEATWLLPGQQPSELRKDMQSLYRRDYIADPSTSARLNPREARGTSERHTSYRLHPKAPPRRDRETYQSLSRQDFQWFPSTRPKPRLREPPHTGRFTANSTYREDFLGTGGASVDDDMHHQEEVILSQAAHQQGEDVVPTTFEAALHCSPYQRKQIAINVSKQLQGAQTSGVLDGTCTVFRPSSIKPTRSHTAGPRVQATSGAIATTPTLPMSGTKRPFQSRPLDRNHSYQNVPFDATTDYRAHFVDFKPARPQLHHPPNQVDFGDTWVGVEDRAASVGTANHPNSLYRASYRGKQPPCGRTQKSVVPSTMLNLPSGFASRTKKEYCPDEDQSPSQDFRSRLRVIDRTVVTRLKTTTEIGDGSTA